MNGLRLLMLFGMACVFALPAAASDFDGSKPLICATVVANDCVRGEECFMDLPEKVGAPDFVRIDFERKSIKGPHRTTPILLMEKDDRQLLLQGKELGHVWVLALDQVNGHFSGTLTSFEGAFVLFGSCTVQ